MKEQSLSEGSEFKFFSLGIVVKEAGNSEPHIIEVSPIESLNTQKSNLIKNNIDEHETKLPNEKGVVVKVKIKTTNTVKAEWFPLGMSNRVTPPIVYPNETVMLFKYGNDEKYYWNTTMSEPKFRKKEAVIYSWSNVPVGAAGWKSTKEPKVADSNSSYSVSVNAFTKTMQLTTPKNDGEEGETNITIHTGENGGIMIQNKELSNKNGQVNFSEIAFTYAGNVTLNCSKHIVVTGLDCMIKSNTDILCVADGVITIKANNIVLSGNVTITGDCNIAGNLTHGGPPCCTP